MLYERRERFGSAGRKLGAIFKKTGLTPNQLTSASIIFALLAAFFLFRNNFIVAAFFLFLTGLMDVADGAVARATGRATKKGAYFDTIADRYAEFIIIAGLLFAALPDIMPSTAFWIMLYLFGSLMTTYAKAAASEKLARNVRGGLLERGERLILLFLFILAASVSSIYLSAGIVILAVLSNVTALQRITKASR